MLVDFLQYRDEQWLIAAHNRHVEGRLALGPVTEPTDPRAATFLIASAAIRALRAATLARQQATP